MGWNKTGPGLVLTPSNFKEVLENVVDTSVCIGGNTNHGKKIYCFGDLGTEQSLKYFCNECNVMGEILLSRYKHFLSQGMITHITTNLSASEIEAS